MRKSKIYRSPLFYVGDKYKLYAEISRYFPKRINRFIEPFTGGGSVSLNVSAKEYLLNDIDKNVISIHKFLRNQANNHDNFFKSLQDIMEKYGLSHSYLKDIVPQELKQRWKKTYYAKFNKNGFNKLKEDYNSNGNKNVLILYILLIYGFNRMLRFNSNGIFNLPVGNVDFNQNVYRALVDYFKITKDRNIKYYNYDFKNFFDKIELYGDDFVYIDPPYLITFSEYNKYWNEETEERLIEILEYLNTHKIKFAISNISHYKNKVNEKFLKWTESYNVYNIKSNYISYHDNSIKTFNEVLVTNYINIIDEDQVSIEFPSTSSEVVPK